MLKHMRWFLLLMSALLSFPSQSQIKEIAITIDDLPFVGDAHNDPGNLRREHERFMKILQTLIDYKVPATGFVIAGSIEKGQWELLEAFQQAGLTLGNHTYSHANLNRVGATNYIEDIAKADSILAPILSSPKYFRYPYLAEGRGQAKQDVYDFLQAHGYTIAPVTIDSKDFRFNEQLLAIHWRNRPQHLLALKRRYIQYIATQTARAEHKAKDKPIKEILLLHANLLNSHALGDVLQFYKDRGYQFVSLDKILDKRDMQTEETTSAIAPFSFSSLP